MPAIDSPTVDRTTVSRLYVFPAGSGEPGSYDLDYHDPEIISDQIADHIGEDKEDVSLPLELAPFHLGCPTAGYESIIHVRTYAVRDEVRGYWLLSVLNPDGY